ncbi:hypothetical protein BATDEDRAFT_87875 [Batrachochytrium dendrobatidis JAM81]|uniref:VTT domain-containing protein n=1 Tax=Batrachochytrium dendrobatidis (strain JAM81 / FGSC 10211) TaxID=684364 RepID=F4NZB3_BATDJ|nr:uncharacterized protein BATDEDRAFT_87875 [Batrachochytrium dendrobatidis JAM81]EGF81261.1 hypothetical protein BATDEDRAFT_87875 [Batrachochytrium dendrobatidis JAM81]|eukprot:XP_006678140.1 hypothetical protein BATDEDRAFT_87875 [Batrachochytrium dendrobatidis JAM81]
MPVYHKTASQKSLLHHRNLVDHSPSHPNSSINPLPAQDLNLQSTTTLNLPKQKVSPVPNMSDTDSSYVAYGSRSASNAGGWLLLDPENTQDATSTNIFNSKLPLANDQDQDSNHPQEDAQNLGNERDKHLEDEPIITRALLINIAIVACIVGIAALIVWQLRLTRYMHVILLWAKEHPTPGLVVLMMLIAILTVTSIPGVGILQVAIGFLYQPFPLALLFSFISINVGAAVATIIGKGFLRSRVESKIKSNSRLRNAKIAIESDGPLMTIMLRCALPFSIGSYMFATIDANPRAYIIGTIFSGLLHAIPDTFIGTILNDFLDPAGSENEDKRPKYLVFLVMGVFDILIITFVACFASRAIRRVDDEQRKGTLGVKIDDIEQSDTDVLVVEQDLNPGFSRFEKWCMVAACVVSVLALSCGVPFIWLYLGNP